MGDALFIGSCAGTFYALDKASGKERWAYDIRTDGKQTSFHGNPLIDADTIFVGADHSCDPDGIGHLYAFNLADGKVRWKHSSPVGISTNVVRIGSNAWFGTVGGDWESVDRRTGLVRGYVRSPPSEGPCDLPKWLSTVGDRVVGVGKDNLIYALSNRKARVLWKVRLPADPSTSPAVQGNQILVGARDRRVYRLAVRDGTIKSSFPVDGIPVGRPLVAGKLAFFILDSDEGKHGLVTALGLEGAVWSATLQSAQSSEQPFEWNGTVVVGDCGGTMTALQTETGATAWSLKLEGCIRAIGGDSRSLYAGVQEGTVFALQP